MTGAQSDQIGRSCQEADAPDKSGELCPRKLRKNLSRICAPASTARRLRWCSLVRAIMAPKPGAPVLPIAPLIAAGPRIARYFGQAVCAQIYRNGFPPVTAIVAPDT